MTMELVLAIGAAMVLVVLLTGLFFKSGRREPRRRHDGGVIYGDGLDGSGRSKSDKDGDGDGSDGGDGGGGGD